MAVYERNYRAYEGRLTPERWRFLVIPRFAAEEVFRSKMLILLLAVAAIGTLIVSSLIYLPHNKAVLALFQSTGGDIAQGLFNYGPTFFQRTTLAPSLFLSFLMAFIVGPPLVSADLRNNGLALYMARPFSRKEYILGKLTVLVPLLAAVSWLPAMWLFVFQCYLAGGDWIRERWRIGLAIFVGLGMWVLILALFSLAISAFVKWKTVARIALVASILIPTGVAPIANGILRTDLAWVLSPLRMMVVLTDGLMGVPPFDDFPVPLAAAAMVGMVLFSLFLLAKKLQPYEVVK